MTGMAAIAFCAVFTSCSKTENLYDSNAVKEMEVAQVYEQYNRAFIATFGQVNPNQNWGFGSVAGTRGVFANGNEWAANDRSDCMYRVPPALTKDQKDVVIKYFQTHRDLDYDDPGWSNYFIQQVYKGGDNPGTNSPEKYKAADGSTDIVGSNHMDHLAAINGDFVDHNNNFNKGDCSEYGNVLDFKGTLNTVVETYPVNDNIHRHKDKINLMTNSTTASFGYYNSNSSVRRTEYTGLVSYQTIIDAMGDEANCLNDGWNRSFMGFDFEMMIGPSLYQTKNGEPRYVEISDIPGNAPQYIWDGEKVIKWWDYDSSWNKVYVEGYDQFIKVGNEKIPYLVTNTNQYAGNRLDAQSTLTNITQSNLKVYKDYSDDVKNVECLNLPLIKAAFEAGYNPTKDSAQDWVKVGGTADGYFSDWIVTLTEAKKYTIVPPSDYTVRIMAEDLNAEAADGDIEDSDWDFNDVVFDVKFDESGDGATIRLVAAGGVLKLTVAGHEVHEEFGENVKENGEYPMINTGKGPNHEPVTFHISSGADKANDGKGIPIIVYKKLSNGDVEPFELKANDGQPSAKFAVKPTVGYLGERVHIDYASNGAFSRAVQDGTNNFLWW